jgi:hypothetical protein
LVVLVSAACLAGRRSARLARRIRSARPDVAVRVLDVALDAAAVGRLPVTVIGTPMWLLGGTVTWLGTPSLVEVLAALDARGPVGGSRREPVQP